MFTACVYLHCVLGERQTPFRGLPHQDWQGKHWKGLWSVVPLIYGHGWWELRAPGNSGLVQTQLPLGCCGHCTGTKRNRNGLVGGKDVAPSHSTSLVQETPWTLAHQQVSYYDSKHLCAHQQCTPASLAPSYSLCTPARCFGSHLDWVTLALGKEGAGKYICSGVSVHVTFLIFLHGKDCV